MIRLVHFTPMSRAHWHWSFFKPLGDPVCGPQRTIDGREVFVTKPTQAWTHVAGTPQFQTPVDADRWADDHAFHYDLCDIPEETCQ
jgi:hypothetical protein